MTPRAHMILGTASGVGKSLITAGLCRLLARSGVRVAPFKPQNMSNNAAACPGGGEIGRAQALQAFACGLEPHVDMNPMLLKPEGDRRAQLVVLGEAVGVLHASRFREDRERYRPTLMAAFERLVAKYDFVFVEGAGSPAEPNLRAADLANMGFARAAGVPAWLVGDIDRGGVFAALLGTVMALDPGDRAHIRGLVVNRFRGDISLLDGTADWLRDRTGVPVVGCLPHFSDLRLPDEDAPYRLQAATPSKIRAGAGGASLRIACVSYPTASNLTDLDALTLDSQLEVWLAREPEQVDRADLVILPGSKAVRRDLGWLEAKGFRPVLERHLRYGGKLLGICGGLQMLGRSISDPHGLEGGGVSRALGWLPIDTELAQRKRVEVIEGIAEWPGPLAYAGYEIHHGRTTHAGERPPFHATSDDDRIFGTYLHGLFDRASFRAGVLDAWFGARAGILAGNAGALPEAPLDVEAKWSAELDRVADALREHLDLRSLESRLGRALT